MQLPANLLTYDGTRRRLWIGGQRCHHGATGAMMTLAAALGLVSARRSPGVLVLLTTGSILMVHDWHDRSVWFKPGWQDQP